MFSAIHKKLVLVPNLIWLIIIGIVIFILWQFFKEKALAALSLFYFWTHGEGRELDEDTIQKSEVIIKEKLNNIQRRQMQHKKLIKQHNEIIETVPEVTNEEINEILADFNTNIRRT